MIKQIFLFLSLILGIAESQAQTWQSMNYSQYTNTVPSGQFIINQYTNDIWMVNDNKVAVIENNGALQLFDYNDLGTLWTGDHLRFVFTKDSIFYMKETMGLFNFNNFSSSLIHTESNISEVTSNNDTVYILRSGSVLAYINGQVIDTYYSASDILAKNTYMYSNNGVLGHNVAYSNVMLWSDPQYLLATINNKKFQRYTDTIYVGTTKGIMFAYNYDILDTITPNNSINMPSPNVLEIEFDDKDSLWAVFGDINDVPISIAKLEGNTWTNIFDNINSPINFSNFKGLEIDTLGNLWVADNIALHTLLTPNSPGWLGISDLQLEQEISIYPNPGSSTISIQNLNNFDAIKIIDLQGRTVLESHSKDQIDVSSLMEGNYIIQVFTADAVRSLSFIKD